MVDDAELIQGTRIPSELLRGDAEGSHVQMLLAALRGARLNAYYPDVRALSSHLQVLSPETHQGVYAGLEVDSRTGLPTYKEWTRGQTDVRLASAQLKTMGPRSSLLQKAKEHPDSAHARQLQRFDYYQRIKDMPLAPLGDMKVQLRRIDHERSVAHFHVLLDKLDASGVFVRYAIDIAQRRGSLEQIANVDPREVATHTQDFQALIYQFTSLDAEFTFVKLASIPGLVVERVIKGTIGPIWTPITQTPEEWKGVETPFLASFGLDMAAHDVLEFKDNDPFSKTHATPLSDAYVSMRKPLGYNVFKDRKFVCARQKLAEVRAFLDRQPTKNILYGV